MTRFFSSTALATLLLPLVFAQNAAADDDLILEEFLIVNVESYESLPVYDTGYSDIGFSIESLPSEDTALIGIEFEIDFDFKPDAGQIVLNSNDFSLVADGEELTQEERPVSCSIFTQYFGENGAETRFRSFLYYRVPRNAQSLAVKFLDQQYPFTLPEETIAFDRDLLDPGRFAVLSASLVPEVVDSVQDFTLTNPHGHFLVVGAAAHLRQPERLTGSDVLYLRPGETFDDRDLYGRDLGIIADGNFYECLGELQKTGISNATIRCGRIGQDMDGAGIFDVWTASLIFPVPADTEEFALTCRGQVVARGKVSDR